MAPCIYCKLSTRPVRKHQSSSPAGTLLLLVTPLEEIIVIALVNYIPPRLAFFTVEGLTQASGVMPLVKCKE